MKLHFARAAGLALFVFSSGVSAQAPQATAPATASPDPASMSVEQINACMRANLAERGSLRDVTLVSTDREKKTRTLKLKLFWKPTKAGEGRLNARVLEPKDVAGSSYLLRESAGAEELYFYLPAANRTQKVSGDDLSRPLWGTDLSYNDLKQIQGLTASGKTERKPDAALGEKKAFVLQTQLAAGGKDAYDKVLSYVDQQSCTLLQSDFLDKAGKRVKLLQADVSTLSQLEPYWFITAYTMQDLARGTQTRIELSDIYLLEFLSEKNFDPATFYLKNE